ncbi:MAG: WD40 repeat domain-containing protein [Anaerolineaceae bacterium]
MKKRSILIFFIWISSLSILAGCTSGTAEKAIMQTQTAEAAAHPAVPVQPADTPTATPLPTEVPTVAPSTLSAQAAALCDAATALAVEEGEASAPLLTMSNNLYEDGNPSGWVLTNSSELKHPATEARSADEVQTVICVEEHRDLTGFYDDGGGAYMIWWLVRVVRWGDGAVVAEEVFYGEEPSQMKVGSGDHYGFSPAKQYREWLLTLFAEDSIFVQGTGVSNLALSPDGQYLVVTGSDFSAKIWDITQHEPVFEQAGETNILSSFLPVIFSPDQLHMAMTYLGGMNIMSVGNWNTVAQIDGIDIWSADFSEDGSLLAAGLGWSYDGVRIYDANTGEQVNNFTLDTPVNRILFSSGDRFLIASAYGCDTCANGQSNGIYVWNFQSGTQIAHIEGVRVQDMALLGDSNILAVAVAKENDIRLYDITSGEQSDALRGHEAMVMAMAANPNGNLLASADSNGTIILWNTITGQIDQKADGYDTISTLAFSADGKTLAVGSSNATVELWNIQ